MKLHSEPADLGQDGESSRNEAAWEGQGQATRCQAWQGKQEIKPRMGQQFNQRYFPVALGSYFWQNCCSFSLVWVDILQARQHILATPFFNRQLSYSVSFYVFPTNFET